MVTLMCTACCQVRYVEEAAISFTKICMNDPTQDLHLHSVYWLFVIIYY